MDWLAWHAGYDDPSSGLSARLRWVQAWLARALDRAPPGPLRLVSLCAGQGHDVIGVLPGHARRDDVRAVLIEADAHIAGQARHAAEQAGLGQVEVREADAGTAASFADALPADVLLLCGIFGNVSEQDIQRTVDAAPAMCQPGATVIWTRHRGAARPDAADKGVVHRRRLRRGRLRVGRDRRADVRGRRPARPRAGGTAARRPAVHLRLGPQKDQPVVIT